MFAVAIGLFYGQPRYSCSASELEKLLERERDLLEADLFGNDLPGVGAPVYLESLLPVSTNANAEFYDSPLDEVQSLMRKGKTQQALEKAQVLVAQQPESLAGRQALANALAMVGRIAEAESVLKSALELHPGTEKLYCHLGGVQLVAEKWAAAQQSFEQALAIDPASPSAALGVALTMEGIGRFDDAQRFYERCLKSNPSAPLNVWLGLAHLYNRNGAFDEAIDLLESRVTSAIENPLAHIALAAAYIGAERKEQAVVQLELARQFVANDDHLLLWIARAFRELDQLEDALETLNAVSSDSAQAARLELAEIMIDSGQQDKAVDLLEQASRSAQTPWVPKRRLVNLKLTEGKFEEAMALAREIASIDGVPLEELDRLGAAFEERERFVEALLLYKAARERYPHEAAPAYRLGVLHAAMESFDESARELKRLLDISPRHPAALKLLCIVYTKQNNWEDAAEVGQALIDSSESSIEDILWVSSVIERAGRTDDAIAAYQSVIARDHRNVVALNNLAVLLTLSGRASEAVELANRAVEETIGQNPDTLDTLGSALLSSHRPDEARVALEKAVQLNPKDPAIRYHLALAHEQCGSIDAALREIESALIMEADFESRVEATEARERLAARLR